MLKETSLIKSTITQQDLQLVLCSFVIRFKMIVEVLLISCYLLTKCTGYNLTIVDSETAEHLAELRGGKSLWCLLYADRCSERCVGQGCQDFCVLTGVTFNCLYTCDKVSIRCIPPSTTTTTTTLSSAS